MEFQWLGPYQVVRKLGRGGMGVVYEGVDVETGQRAALKVLSAALSEEQDFRSRFEAEIETLRRLKHPNIVRLFGFGQQEGLLFYAMELVDGPSLDTELRRGRRFLWPEVVQIGLQICRGLRHAHDRGVIHRDLKPGNLLWASDGTVKLADFGIAQLFGRTRITAVGSVVGTLDYMAPEQAEGGLVDARADLYSLGAVLYALLSGRPPLRAKTLSEMLDKLHNSRPTPIRHYAPETPAALEQLLDQFLEKDPERRIAAAQIASRRLEALLQATTAAPEGSSQPEQAFKEESPPAETGPRAPEDQPKAVPMDADDAGTESWIADQPRAEQERTPAAEKEVVELPETKSMTWPVAAGGAGLPVSQAAEDAISAISLEPGEKGGDASRGAMPPDSNAPASSQADQEVSCLLAPTRQATPPEFRPERKPSVLKEEAASGVGEKGVAYRPELTRRMSGSQRPTHFTSVSEEELDQMPVEEPHRPWVSWQTWVLAAALLAVGGTVWYLLQPSSADALYERIARTAEEGTIEALRTVEPTIQEFLT
ncbi:MAG TPA: protein kinase, partial [Thermoguttaceae bacterium]|nr:protein kinase [Thermoguttaceae bacterium]